jgi:rhodanese-related sulfurtransferase
VQRISRDELRALLDAAAVLVEALPEPQYRADYRVEHLPGAVNVPGEVTAELAARLAPDPARTVVTYCAGLPFDGTRATWRAA